MFVRATYTENKTFWDALVDRLSTRIASGGDDGRLRWKQLENTRGEGGAIGRLWS